MPLASDGSNYRLESSPPARKRFRFTLRTALLVTTIVAVVAGLYFARQLRRAAAARRFESTWAQLETLVQAPVDGFAASGGLQRSMPNLTCVQWRFALKTSPETAKLGAAALLRKIRVHFGTPLVDAGLAGYSPVSTGRPLSDESIFRDDGGSAVVLRIDLDGAKTQADVSMLWIYHWPADAR
jgi:hypothetical protein